MITLPKLSIGAPFDSVIDDADTVSKKVFFAFVVGVFELVMPFMFHVLQVVTVVLRE